MQISLLQLLTYSFAFYKDIYQAGVQYILDTVVSELRRAPHRKFSYVEMAFFQRWWNEQDELTRLAVKELVRNGQLTFVNGGMTMHDEATTYYNEMIDNMSHGMRFLRRTFDAAPRTAWQIDPFGHSSTHAALVSEMGLDGLFFARIDYQDKDLRAKQRNLEFIWRGTASLPQAEIFTGVLWFHYGPPPGLCFDEVCSDDSVQDDPALEDFNVQERVDLFVKRAQEQYKNYNNGNQVMFLFGEDFQWQNAHQYFINLDRLITAVNKDGRVNAFYSTPDEYVKAIHASNHPAFSVKTDDFFPYADNPYSYWTGYFTSRVALKGYVRETNGRLQTARLINTLMRLNADLEEAVLAQTLVTHHDGVSGTEKQAVAFDYALRLARGDALVRSVINSGLAKLHGLPAFVSCPLLNVTTCPALQSLSPAGVVVTFLNPLGLTSPRFVRLPVPSEAVVVSTLSSGSPVPVASQTVPVVAAFPDTRDSLPYVVVFRVEPQAVGTTSFLIRPAGAGDDPAHVAARSEVLRVTPQLAADYVTINNTMMSFTYSTSSLGLIGARRMDKGLSFACSHTFAWWNSSAGNNLNSTQASGAYIFRPNSTHSVALPPTSLVLVTGPVVQEAVQSFGAWVTQSTRLYAGDQPYAEVEPTVGPIPIADGLGKEVTSVIRVANLATRGVFYTDANGREMQQRKRDFRPTWTLNLTEPIASNFYPVNTAIYVEDAAGTARFTVVTDRSLAGSSLADGGIDLMLHRRTLYDDSRGVGEPLNETAFGYGLVARATHRWQLDAPQTASPEQRLASQALSFPLEPAFAPAPSDGVFAGLADRALTKAAIPSALHVLTLSTEPSALTPGAEVVLLRISHLFPTLEPPLNKPQSIDLLALLAVSSAHIVETNLAGNQRLADQTRLKWGDNNNHKGFSPDGEYSGSFVVTLNPLEIRTFEVTVEPAAATKRGVKIN
jgi:hypothetical protein